MRTHRIDLERFNANRYPGGYVRIRLRPKRRDDLHRLAALAIPVAAAASGLQRGSLARAGSAVLLPIVGRAITDWSFPTPPSIAAFDNIGDHDLIEWVIGETLTIWATTLPKPARR